MTKKPNDGQFELRLGALTGKLSAQLRKQKVRFDAPTMKTYEEHLHRIMVLSIHGLLTGPEKNKAFGRLVKKVQRHVQKYN